jgi:lipid A disaccharide synthetase
MAFVKWGVDLKPADVKTTFAVDGIPIKGYVEILTQQRKAYTLIRKMLACLDDERDAVLIQEAHSLLARMGCGND